MKKVYGYIRVSTAKQGEGVSLVVQKEAITRYAEQYHLSIIQWFEEKETAAKQGRPLFNTMLKLIRAGKADGVIMHKIDRSARNLKDWAELGNLIDQGVEVHFVHESLDLQARGGRLSADIQAVIAADYIRNLRQEAIKGLYGRLNQGIYPFNAPTGYLNNGKGKCKTIDPSTAPLVRKAFELYASRRYSLDTLVTKMRSLGMKTITHKPITKNGLSHILNNPFYIGIIKVKGLSFKGIHEPLIAPGLFKRVQTILKSKTNQKILKFDFLFRKFLKCKLCGYSLIGEQQKGHVYYRCHTKHCPTKSIRETILEHHILNHLDTVALYDEEAATLNTLLEEQEKDWSIKQEELQRVNQLHIRNIEQRLERLTDCYIEGGLDKTTYEHRKEKLLMEIKEKEHAGVKIAHENVLLLRRVRKFLELSKSLANSYRNGILEEKRDLLESVTSNFLIEGKKIEIPMVSPFSEVSKRWFLELGGHTQDTPLLNKGQIADVSKSSVLTSGAPIWNTSPIKKEPLPKEKLKALLEHIIEVVSNLPDQPHDSNDYAV